MGFQEGPHETSFLLFFPTAPVSREFFTPCFLLLEATSPHTYTFIHKHIRIEHKHLHTHRQACTHITIACTLIWASLVTQMVKNLPAMWETWVGKTP